jgi:hypothetical protein
MPARNVFGPLHPLRHCLNVPPAPRNRPARDGSDNISDTPGDLETGALRDQLEPALAFERSSNGCGFTSIALIPFSLFGGLQGTAARVDRLPAD